MSFVSRPLCVRSLVLSLAASLTALLASPAAHAQASSGTSTLDRQLERIDFGINGVGSFTHDVAGTNYLGQSLTHKTSNTFGALITFRYTKSPWIGGEFNIGYARYTHNYNRYLAGGVQTNSFEYTAGYVAHPPHLLLGAQPFLAAGGGLLYFHPTSGGGQGLPSQGAGAFYYSVGAEKLIVPHIGVRAQFRQLFYLSPDFYQNYLNINQRTYTFEPGAGFYIHF
jgi:opacity protein-like surface antigen